MKYYHGTSKDNIDSILKHGLLISGNIPERKWFIYASPYKVIAANYGEAIFEIESDENDKISSLNDDEVFIWNDIKPDRIKLIETMSDEINGRYVKSNVVGEYNESVFICPECNERVGMDFSKDDVLADYITHFSPTKYGFFMNIECPKCFTKWYCHAGNHYNYFLESIEKGTQKFFRE